MMTGEDLDELTLLLPFYVNDTVAPADARRIEAVLARSAELRAELAIVDAMAQQVRKGGEILAAQDDTGGDRLQAVLGRLDDRPPAPIPAGGVRLAGLLAMLNPRRWHPAVALSLVVAVGGQTLFIGRLSDANQAGAGQIAALGKQVGELQFALASGPEAARRGNVVVQLRADASWSGVAALLGKEGLSIVDGPSDGALTLSSDASGAALDALIDRLRASPLVTAAEKGA